MTRIDPFLFDRGHGNCSTKPEEGKDGEDYYDQSNKVDKLVHVPLLIIELAGMRVPRIVGHLQRISSILVLSRAQFGRASPVPIR